MHFLRCVFNTIYVCRLMLARDFIVHLVLKLSCFGLLHSVIVPHNNRLGPLLRYRLCQGFALLITAHQYLQLFRWTFPRAGHSRCCVSFEPVVQKVDLEGLGRRRNSSGGKVADNWLNVH